jgi:hypothetical protein
MSDTITWLHLSDLHACTARTGWDANQVTKTLCDDLKRVQQKHGLRPDLIFFTGDAAFGHLGNESGKAIQDQFREAHKFLTAVRQSFDPEVNQRDVYLVPGNHDVNRTETDDSQYDWLNHQARTLDEVISLMQSGKRQWQRFMERLTDFATFLQEQGCEHLLTDRDRLIYADAREIAGLRVGIVGFNSAWSCSRDKEKGRLWAGGIYQAGELCSRLGPVDFAIALIHHPGNWFVEQEDPNVLREMERRFQFGYVVTITRAVVGCLGSSPAGGRIITAAGYWSISGHGSAGVSRPRLRRRRTGGKVRPLLAPLRGLRGGKNRARAKGPTRRRRPSITNSASARRWWTSLTISNCSGWIFPWSRKSTPCRWPTSL